MGGGGETIFKEKVFPRLDFLTNIDVLRDPSYSNSIKVLMYKNRVTVTKTSSFGVFFIVILKESLRAKLNFIF